MRRPTNLQVVALLVAALVATTGGALAADEELTVLTTADGPGLHEYLLSEVARQYATRRDEVSQALTSPELVAARRENLREKLRTIVGELPQRTPLNARTVGTIDGDGYRIEKVVYESRPGHHVTANLYLPVSATSASRVPGVLVPCGHSDNGKASGPYQSVCILLAKNGCAALIYDPIGQGERNQVLELPKHGTTEHTLVGVGALAVGWSTAHYRIWDGLRSMDYLAGRAEVDPARLGCTGNSGGGTMTTWLMAVDQRIVAAAPSCFVTTVERLFNTIGPQDCEQHFPDQGALGLEHADFVTMRAPRPTLILAAERDFFDIGGTRTAYAESADLFRVLGKPEQVGLFTFNDEHGFSRPRREAAVAWMRRWLAGDERTVTDDEPPVRSDAELQVTAAGQVLKEFPGEVSVVDLSKRWAAELAAMRKPTWRALDGTGRMATIRSALRLPDKLALEAHIESRGTVDRATDDRPTWSIEKLAIVRKGRVPLAAVLCRLKQPVNQKLPAVVYVDSSGKARGLAADGPVERLVRQGHTVLAVDLSGWGETADAAKGAKYHNEEFRTAMIAMHVGQPLVGMRVEDLLVALRSLAKLPGVDPATIHLIGVDRAGPVALHAAAIEPGFATVEVVDSLANWTNDLVARPLAANLLGQVVPGALAHYDLPELAEMLGKRVTFAAAN